MIYDLNTSVDLRWLFDHRCYIHLRWSCFFFTESPVTMRIRHYFASLAPPADQLPNDEEDAPRKKEVASHVYDLSSQHALKFSWLLFLGHPVQLCKIYVTMEHKRWGRVERHERRRRKRLRRNRWGASARNLLAKLGLTRWRYNHEDGKIIDHC